MTVLQEPGLLGLSADEAAARLTADGPNELPTARPRNLLQQAWGVLQQPMLLLLLGAGTVNFLLAEPLDGVTLMSFVLVVIGISIYQEHETENALTALRDLSSPRARDPRRRAGADPRTGARVGRPRPAHGGRPGARRRRAAGLRQPLGRRVRPHRGVGGCSPARWW
jgi:hypothetical protein